MSLIEIERNNSLQGKHKRILNRIIDEGKVVSIDKKFNNRLLRSSMHKSTSNGDNMTLIYPRYKTNPTQPGEGTRMPNKTPSLTHLGQLLKDKSSSSIIIARPELSPITESKR